MNDPHAPTSAFDAVPAGEHLVAMDIPIRNIRTHRDFTISPVALFDLTDVTGAVRKLTISGDLALIDGVVGADEARRGFVVYRVADTAKTPLAVRVKGELTSGGVTFAIP